MIKANKILHYRYKREAGQNPYTGIVSFQHFRGEKLYSDIVVKPENNMCETENVECYPVPDYVPENGRNEGYYPDSSVVYIRVLWKEFEPEQGVYRYDFIEQILRDAKAHKQTVAFRLIAHSTRACDDVPDWLKTLIPCPERPEGKRVKDSPTDPLFVELFCKAIRKFGERFDSDPTLSSMDISLPGAWGEGHKLENYPEEDIEKLFDTYTSVFSNTVLMGQLAKPHFVKKAAQKRITGWRGDGLGEPYHTTDLYPPYIEQLSENWKTGPVSFESYWWLCEWKRKGWDIAPIIENTLNWHISSFNPKSIPIPYEWQEQVEDWISKMGYHYQIDSFAFPEKAMPGDEVELVLNIDNVGVAPCYYEMHPVFYLVSENQTVTLQTGKDVREWCLGKYENRFVLKLPEKMEKGQYAIRVGIENNVEQEVFFCTDAERIGNAYEVGMMEIG